MDETHVLLDARTPADTLVGASTASQFLHPAFAALGYDVTLFRLSGLALLVLSTVLLSIRARHLVGILTDWRLGLSAQGLIAISLLGSMLYYFWFIRAPSYNLLIVVGTYLFTTLFLWVLEANPETRLFSVRTACTGALWVFCLLVKFPSAFALLAIAGTTLVVWYNWSLRCVGLFVAHFTAGAAAALALYLTFMETPATLITRVWGMVQLLQSPGFKSPPSGNLVRYLSQSSHGLLDALGDFWPALACIAISILTSLGLRDRDNAMRCISIGFFVALVLFDGLAIRAGFYGWQFTVQDLFYFYLIATALLLMTIAGAALTNRRFNASGIQPIGGRRLSVILVVLFTIPLAAAFGTGNPITVNALLAMGPWFIGTAILARILSMQLQRSWIGPAVLVTLGAMACADTVSGAVHPYGIYASIFEQTERTELGLRGHSLKLDMGTSSYVRELRDMAGRGGLTAQSDVLFFYNSPGSVFVIGAHSPGFPWFFSEAPEASTFVLARVPRERLRRAYIMIDLQGPSPPPLSDFGLNFPADYDLVGEVLRRPIQHHVQLWRPRLP